MHLYNVLQANSSYGGSHKTSFQTWNGMFWTNLLTLPLVG